MRTTIGNFFCTLIVLFLNVGCKEKLPDEVSNPRPVKLFEVSDNSYQDTHFFPGFVMADRQAVISFRLPGSLVEVAVQNGQMVKVGQLLARLDDKDIKNELADKQAVYDLTKANFQRQKTLAEQKQIPQFEFDVTLSQLRSAQASLDSSIKKLADTRLIAPFSGRVAQLKVENFEQVQAGQPVLNLQNDRVIAIKVLVSEKKIVHADFNRLIHGDGYYQPSVIFPALPDHEYSVFYKEHSTEVTSGAQGYEVTFSMLIPDNVELLPGMSAQVKIDLNQLVKNKRDMAFFVVPISAIYKDSNDEQTKLWVFDPVSETVRMVVVDTGELTSSGIQIRKGLRAGDLIVVAGVQHMQEGMKVVPLIKPQSIRNDF